MVKRPQDNVPIAGADGARVWGSLMMASNARGPVVLPGAVGSRALLTLVAALTTLLFCLPPDATAATKRNSTASKSSGQQVYRWVDENGVVHFGDQVPAQYAATDRQVLNQYGVPVQTQQGTVDAHEKAAAEQAAAVREAQAAAARRDEILLSTYLSVEEIEALRDRRTELMTGQIAITENYLSSLHEKLTRLKDEASDYKPYSKDPEAEPIDGKLAQELADTLDSIALYEKTLSDTLNRKSEMVAEFDADIARFRELQGQ